MGPDYRLKQRGGHLVSVSWVTSEQTRASFRNPALIGAAVPGWRKAVVLADTDGVAAGLVADAIAWRWDDVADVCDAWVAEQITGYAEEVQKLCNSLQRGDMYTSLIERDVVAMRLAFVMSVQRRILYGTENVLWELVAEIGRASCRERV